MVLGLMKKGDKVLNVTNEFVVIKRKEGEVDIIPLIKEERSFRVNYENIVTIGYGDSLIIQAKEMLKPYKKYQFNIF